MNCKYCGAALEDGVMECPACGKQLDETAEAETVAEETAQADGPVTEAVTEPAVDAEEAEVTEEAEGAEETEETEATGADAVKSCGRTEPCAGCEALSGCEQAGQYFADELAAQKKARRSGAKKIVLGVVAGVLVIAIVAAILVSALSGSKVMHTNEAGYTSYTATEDQLTDRTLNQVIATCGSRKLTNRELSFYYWQQYYSFANLYGAYLSYIMDPTLGLDEQMYNDDVTWQQQFLDVALQNFGHVAALVQEAAAEGFTLSAEDEEYLSTLAESFDAAAVNYGYESGDAFVQQQFGPAATLDGYAAFARDNMTASAYLQSLTEKLTYTEQDVSKYYDDHADEYVQQRVEKLDMPNIDIRHILITPDGQNEDGTYTDEAWQAAEQKAHALMQQWLTGDASEESFAELAVEHSADGSAQDGGLISGVYPGQMVDEFNDWCFDASRKVGDSGLVKTPFGYHLMYLSAIGEEIHWYTVAEADYLNEQAAAIENEIAEKYALKTKPEKAAVYDVLAASKE